MPMASVNEAIYNFLKPEASNIPNLGVVYRSLPKVANEADLFQNTFPGLGVGGAFYLFLSSQRERRIAFGGPPPPYGGGGNKMRMYDLSILMILKSDLPQTEDGWIQYMSMVDGLTQRVQSNRAAGTNAAQYGGDGSGIIFSMGEGNAISGGDDIVIDHFIPRTIDGGVVIFQGLAKLQVAEDFVST